MDGASLASCHPAVGQEVAAGLRGHVPEIWQPGDLRFVPADCPRIPAFQVSEGRGVRSRSAARAGPPRHRSRRGGRTRGVGMAPLLPWSRAALTARGKCANLIARRCLRERCESHGFSPAAGLGARCSRAEPDVWITYTPPSIALIAIRSITRNGSPTSTPISSATTGGM